MVGAPMADTAALLLAVRPGRVGNSNALVLADLPAARFGALSIVAGPVPGSFYAVGADEQVELAIDPVIPAIAVRRWFGGVYTVERAPGGSRVVHRVHLVRPGRERFMSDIQTRMRDWLTQVLSVIADRLGVPEIPEIDPIRQGETNASTDEQPSDDPFRSNAADPGVVQGHEAGRSGPGDPRPRAPARESDQWL
jgi:hypothetical protein